VTRIARDGLPARVGGPWTREKLDYVERYATAFMRAMSPHRRAGRWSRLVYVDLLAGPGLGIDRDTGAEFDGSPLRALKVEPAFDKLFFGDLRRRNVAALRRRIGEEHMVRVDLLHGDCNELVGKVVKGLTSRTLGLAFVDPEGFEASFKMFEMLATRPMDVLFLFPSRIGIGRNLRAFACQPESPMDALWGGREWREFAPAKLAAGRPLDVSEALELDRPWVARFRAKIGRLGFTHQDEGDPCFKNEKNVPMYHLLFFSKSEAGLAIWRRIKRIEPSGQRGLPLA
jgi:three-Cys-motif partner protein